MMGTTYYQDKIRRYRTPLNIENTNLIVLHGQQLSMKIISELCALSLDILSVKTLIPQQSQENSLK